MPPDPDIAPELDSAGRERAGTRQRRPVRACRPHRSDPSGTTGSVGTRHRGGGGVVRSTPAAPTICAPGLVQVTDHPTGASGRPASVEITATVAPGPVREARAVPVARTRIPLESSEGRDLRDEPGRAAAHDSQRLLRPLERPPHRIVQFHRSHVSIFSALLGRNRHEGQYGRQGDRERPDTLLGGPLAHRVEQGTFNPKVARSRLARPTESPGQRHSGSELSSLTFARDYISGFTSSVPPFVRGSPSTINYFIQYILSSY